MLIRIHLNHNNWRDHERFTKKLGRWYYLQPASNRSVTADFSFAGASIIVHPHVVESFQPNKFLSAALLLFRSNSRSFFLSRCRRMCLSNSFWGTSLGRVVRGSTALGRAPEALGPATGRMGRAIGRVADPKAVLGATEGLIVVGNPNRPWLLEAWDGRGART